ncbi:hypothetical protein [Streptococcus equi]
MQDKILAALNNYLVPSIAEKTQIQFASHENNAGMIGAYYHFKHKEQI